MNVPLRKSRAFSLIELLIVVAVIAFLAVILFPTLRRERENTRQVSCQSNLRQIALGMSYYTKDYDNTFMMLVKAPPCLPYRLSSLAPYLPYARSTHLWKCPSDPMTANDWDGTSTDNTVSYGFNGAWLSSQRLANVAKSSETVLFTENIFNKAAQTGTPLCYPQRGYPGMMMGVPVYRHFERADVVFVDGHGKALDKDVLEQSSTQEAGIPLDAYSYAVLWNRI